MGQIYNPPSSTPTYTQPIYVVGRWYATVEYAALTNGATAQNNKVQLYPFYLQRAITISDLGSRINGVEAGKFAQLAIYASDPVTNYPTGNALAVTGNISTTSSGAISADITGPNVTLQPGLYWAASNTDGASVSLQMLSSAPVLGFMIGSTTLANITPSFSSGTCFLQVAQTFGTWPDLTSASLSEVAGTAANAGFIYMKAA